ncbi:MAG: serine hydrolase domain-containing protein [Microbacterium sp.]
MVALSAMQRLTDQVVEEALAAGLGTAAAAGIAHRGQRAVSFGGHLALDAPEPVAEESLFDLASITKTYTAAVLLQLVNDGRIDPDAPVGSVIDVGSGRGAPEITLRMLLTHTAGFPHDVFLWRDEPGMDPMERLERVIRTPLESAPGAVFRYSCTGYIAAGVIAERLTGKSLPQLVSEFVTGPLGVSRTRYGPVEPECAVATEDMSFIGRGMVRGQVHDELSWWLGGRTGNAGLFAPVGDVLSFAESFLDDRLLGPRGWPLAVTPADIAGPDPGFGHTLGLRTADHGFMGRASGVGHTGFTGTMWWADPHHQVAVVLLTNRVHPTRRGAEPGPLRRAFSNRVVERIRTGWGC